MGTNSINHLMTRAKRNLADGSNGGRERCREQQRLAKIAGGKQAEDLLNGGAESHVKQLVSFIKDQNLETVHVLQKAVILEMINQPSRRSNKHQRRLSIESIDLTSHIRAAEGSLHFLQLRVSQQCLRLLRGLHGKLTCRRQHQNLNTPRARLGAQDGVQGGQQESQGLPSAGLRFRDHIRAGNTHRNRLLLHFGHLLVFEDLGDSSLQDRQELELGEASVRQVGQRGGRRTAGPGAVPWPGGLGRLRCLDWTTSTFALPGVLLGRGGITALGVTFPIAVPILSSALPAGLHGTAAPLVTKLVHA
mmetsp:Transcript_74243/g.198037  ORF Transcript_74243/g.198037 Transcript_74243/m.198037 type:complete len:305 (-) Transcript_74243:7-921(-)